MCYYAPVDFREPLYLQSKFLLLIILYITQFRPIRFPLIFTLK